MKELVVKKYLYVLPLAFLLTWTLWGCESSISSLESNDGTNLNPVETARPDWAGGGGNHDSTGHGNGKGSGNPNAGTKKGDTYGDMYIILRDDNGIPILNSDGYVQPVDANNDPLPLDEEGNLIDEEAAIEVEIGRLNVSRSPAKVLDRRLTEVHIFLEQADAITTDPAGRLLVTTAGVEKTIDAPLENLALYRELMNNGKINVNLKATVDIDPALGNLFNGDSDLSANDMLIAASLLAGGADKTVTMTVDEIIYINTIIGLEGTIPVNEVHYINFANFIYNRSAHYGSRTADILVETSPGVFERRTVNIYETVFTNINYSGSGTAAAFTRAADDARRVINYIHEYEVPVTP